MGTKILQKLKTSFEYLKNISILSKRKNSRESKTRKFSAPYFYTILDKMSRTVWKDMNCSKANKKVMLRRWQTYLMVFYLHHKVTQPTYQKCIKPL